MMNIYIFYSMITSGLPYDNIMWNNNKSQFTKISFWHTEKTHRKKNGNFVLFIFVNDSSHRLFFYLINNFFSATSSIFLLYFIIQCHFIIIIVVNPVFCVCFSGKTGTKKGNKTKIFVESRWRCCCCVTPRQTVGEIKCLMMLHF